MLRKNLVWNKNKFERINIFGVYVSTFSHGVFYVGDPINNARAIKYFPIAYIYIFFRLPTYFCFKFISQL